MSAEIMSVSDLLSLDLRIPDYQRPYRWTDKNVADLLGDIDGAIAESESYPEFRYRIGSVILHENVADGCYDIVDGQQRLLSLTLLLLCLEDKTSFHLLDNSTFSSRETKHNLRANYAFMVDWVGFQSEGWRRSVLEAFASTLEAVVIIVSDIEEAFQLFDSQNTRGRALDPHDLLKAYHLRAMRGDPYGMRHVVTRWEEFESQEVRAMFARYLFPVQAWELGEKARPFTTKEIDVYKGIDAGSGYTYAARARRAAPSFQIGEPFIEGEDFFLMAERYLRMVKDIELELRTNREFAPIWEELGRRRTTAGHGHACMLFRCTLFAYYDRFHNFDERAVRKLFCWALMLRVDMTALGFESVNKYAAGEDNGRFTNVIPMFSRISRARRHTDIADTVIVTKSKADASQFNTERRDLAEMLSSWSKGGAR